MGGRGSGSWYRWGGRKTTTESQKRIDIRWLKQQGYLQAGTMGSLSWSCRGEATGSINYSMIEEGMLLNYRYRINGGEWEPVEQRILFDRTRCNYGGNRTWFLCPRCGKRVVVLYGAGKLFLCRHCYDLTYRSQQEGVVDRMMRKQWKIRERLGASNSLFDPILFKPKGMHQKTFDRLRNEADYANNRSCLIMRRRLGIKIEW